MKVELIANVSVNGQLILAEQSSVYQAPQQISGMGFARAMQADDLYFNLFPVLINGGGVLQGKIVEYKLKESSVNEGVVCLHYEK